VPSIGHNAVRDFVMGRANRRPDREELRRMREEVRLGLEAGARTLSFGLIYMPGAFSHSSATPSDASQTARRYTHFLRCASAWSLLRPTHKLCDALPWQR
jgi:N-acyl-D-aspartate/D-glutamate deacylase